MNNTRELWEKNTIMRPTWTLEELRRAKEGHTVSVVIPTLNEQQRIGTVIDSIHPHVGSLIDEIIVVDSHSTDDTARVAEAAGATVFQLDAILPDIPVCIGKGESLWRGMMASRGDIVMFMDGDLKNPDSMFVPNTIAPLLLNPDIDLVKGFYRRPLKDSPSGGGRMTELVGRPLLASFCPEASFLVQPLGGEYAIRRKIAERLPFASGYGVEIGLVMDIVRWWGAERICQVNLGVRQHRNRPLSDLGQMAREVSDTVLRRANVTPADAPLVQFDSLGDADGSYSHYILKESEAEVFDRPPLVTIPEYRQLWSEVEVEKERH